MKKIYLAIPYSGIEEESFKIANYVAHKLMADGHIVFSPISQNHPIAKAHSLPTGWEFWQKLDEAFIEWCDELHIVAIHTLCPISAATLIESSKGCQAEISFCRKLNKEIKTYHYHGEN